MKRRAFLLMCAAAVVPRQRPDVIEFREPYWTVDLAAIGSAGPQRIVYTGIDWCSPHTTDLSAVRLRVLGVRRWARIA